MTDFNFQGRNRPRGVASNPIKVRFSEAKLRAIYPEYFRKLFPRKTISELPLEDHVSLVGQRMAIGDTQPAIVISKKPYRVAAYTDELDCVVPIQFPTKCGRRNNWEVGTRLLTINTYFNYEFFDNVVSDIIPGPKAYGRYFNFNPIIADLLTDDLAVVEKRKQAIAESRWVRAWQMAQHYLQHRPGYVRDSCPFQVIFPGTPKHLLSVAPAIDSKPTFHITASGIKQLNRWLASINMDIRNSSVVLYAHYYHPEFIDRHFEAFHNSVLDTSKDYFIFHFENLHVLVKTSDAHTFNNRTLDHTEVRGFHFRHPNWPG